MRFEITLKISKNEKGSQLPINYQYELSSWIYKVLNEGDPIFSEWLHFKGYKSKEKPFKLFTFSNLIIPFYKISGDRIDILSNSVKLIISFLPDEAISPFITGLFKERRAIIGDKFSQVVLEVSEIISLPKIEIRERMTFKTISPLFVDEEDPIQGYPKHIAPNAENYSQLLHSNLLEKYRAFQNKEVADNCPDTKIRIIGQPMSKLIEIKSGTPQMTKIRAYNFTFEITGSRELIEVGYYGGFGRLGSQGFGCVEGV
ncbi:MAG: CRISPR-associated endoribonuclease Cas6 [Bacteroidetes bacterium GWF2_40_14]|nr:MAG: CRISPR-associated endoribonuclease Cas6 [Bacteroidetes bacterium GWF2_40_14]